MRSSQNSRTRLHGSLLALALLVLAALGFGNDFLSSSARRAAPARETVAAPSAAAPALGELPPADAARREPVSRDVAQREPDPELDTRAEQAIQELLLALESSEFEDAAWQRSVLEQARTLDAGALPGLEALLDDERRSIEEHVAASELVAALRTR